MANPAIVPLVVGEPFLRGQTLWPEGVVYTCRDGRHSLALFIDEPHARQVADVETGVAELALVVAPPALIVASRFGESINWSDSAFNPYLLGPNAPELVGEPAATCLGV